MVRGIRLRITALATLVVVAVLAVTALALITSQRRLLTDNIDESLFLHSADLATAAADGGVADPLTGQGDDDAIAQVVAADGRVLAATENFATQPALPAPPRNAETKLGTTRLPLDEAQYRLLSRRVGDLVIHTGTPLDDVEESTAALERGLSVAIPIVAFSLALLIWWLVGRTLRPVEGIRREVADITGTNLDRRVPEPASNDEIARLARTMNAMLDRVEAAAERQQQFVADASHELRSPLTRMRSELEVDLSSPAVADLAATHRSVLEETGHLQRLVDDLLFLARSDGDAGEERRIAVDLDDIVLRETGRLRDVGRVQVDIGGVSAAQVMGDPDELTRVVRNLADNASRHARSTVTFTVSETAEHATVSVADDGPGIPMEDHERIFERFTRLDAARSNTDGGSGLGLAIAREIVERHGGTIVVDPTHAPGARFVIELPRRADRGS